MAKRRIPSEMEAVYVISVAASLSGMHPQTLRIYETPGSDRAVPHAGGHPPLLGRRSGAALADTADDRAGDKHRRA